MEMEQKGRERTKKPYKEKILFFINCYLTFHPSRSSNSDLLIGCIISCHFCLQSSTGFPLQLDKIYGLQSLSSTTLSFISYGPADTAFFFIFFRHTMFIFILGFCTCFSFCLESPCSNSLSLFSSQVISLKNSNCPPVTLYPIVFFIVALTFISELFVYRTSFTRL